ncbi:MAG: UDP-3-O-acyl-N-acetylglucosamine deacetylase [Stellaceae bacterium]
MSPSGRVRQRTLNSVIRCRGTALHGGEHVTMVFHPAEPGTGILFRRADRGGAMLRAHWRSVKESVLCTSIDNGDGLQVTTIEHVMAALSGLEIDNCIIELDGPEVPAMDGSAAPFVFLFECAGIVEQDAPRRAIEILKPVRVGDAQRSAMLMPGDDFTVTFAIDFAASAIRRQNIRLRLDPDTFKREIAPARTFGFLEDVNALRAAGLARGGSMANAIVIGEGRVLNAEGLRFPDEFVRHKALDAIGDLYLAGAPLVGQFSGVRSGHALNRQLLEALFADRAAWAMTDLDGDHAAYDLDWEDNARRVSA